MNAFPFKSVAVFCGSSKGSDPFYVREAVKIGKCLADQKLAIVYGGAVVGLMGQVADAALAAGGRVTGVIPRSLKRKEIEHTGLSKCHVVETMHERKQLMYDLSDVFIFCPGGLGTLDEAFEILTWSQLGLHIKPCGFLNLRGYFDPLVAQLDRMKEEGFLRSEHREKVIVEDNIEQLLLSFVKHKPAVVEKWINHEAI
ncbi:MAG: TIGR00730 family Rossman fold protein [Deltaproteobacteria bacterium]|nr:TIGR00730 family Rossman fold protein [Deltaproteobacteria bacterium]